MDRTYPLPCPNCGGTAIRSYFTSQATRYSNCPKNQVIQTECPSCDYLMIMCSLSGNVIEAHSSSTSAMTREGKNNYSHPAIATGNTSIISWPTRLSA